MIIAQISDTHIDLNEPDRGSRLRDLERCVSAINQLESAPDLVIHTGDLTHNGTPAEYTAVRSILDTLRCPYHVTVGNRDDRETMRAAFPADCSVLQDSLFAQYCIDDFPLRLIVLDTKSASSNQGDFCRIRADNLHTLLTGQANKPTAIFLHHPPFEVSESDYPFQFKPWDAVDRMSRALNGHHQVLGMFCGHSHREATGAIGPIPVSSMPSVAVDLRLGAQPAAFRSEPIFKVHTFDGNGGFSSEFHGA